MRRPPSPLAWLLAAAMAPATVGAAAQAPQVATPAPQAAAAGDEAAIRQALMTTFDRPEARLQVAPVVLAGDHAVAGWQQADRGGRALLRRQAGQWRVVACGGAALAQAKVLQGAGLPPADARQLAQALARAEAALPAGARQRFDRFGATVQMGADGAHPPVHATHHPPAAHRH